MAAAPAGPAASSHSGPLSPEGGHHDLGDHAVPTKMAPAMPPRNVPTVRAAVISFHCETETLPIVSPVRVIVAQSCVGWEHRGVATSTNMLSRSMGSAVGVAVFGAIVNSRVADSASADDPLDLEHPSAGVLAPAIHTVFVCSAVVALALVLSGLLMPRHAGADALADS